MVAMKALTLGISAALAGCAASPVVPPAPASEPLAPRERPEVREEVVHEIPVNGLRIRFWGNEVPDGVRASFGVTRMDVVFGDGQAVPFQPTGSLYFSDWRFDILSPDQAHVLLLQDRYGPYHVVRVEALAEYLQGAEPAHSFGYANPEGSAWIHEAGRWIDSKTVAYRAGLTTQQDFEFWLGAEAPEP